MTYDDATSSINTLINENPGLDFSEGGKIRKAIDTFKETSLLKKTLPYLTKNVEKNRNFMSKS